MPRYDVIIPHWGVGHLTDVCLACLDSLAAAGGDFRLIFVDNGSEDFGRLAPALTRVPHTVIRNSENLGFIRATNQGIAFSNAPFVVLLNNDTIVPAGWLPALEQPFKRLPGAGLSGPLTDTPHSWQGQWLCRSGLADIVLAPGRMLAFFCVMISRDVIERIGYLDESYGVGFGDDDDYCRRAEAAGYKLVLCQSLRVSHRHRTSFQARFTPEQIKELQDNAMRRFRLSKGVTDGPRRSHR